MFGQCDIHTDTIGLDSIYCICKYFSLQLFPAPTLVSLAWKLEPAIAHSHSRPRQREAFTTFHVVLDCCSPLQLSHGQQQRGGNAASHQDQVEVITLPPLLYYLRLLR